jgi:predicted GIY-YIG superfamily endonuclease
MIEVVIIIVVAYVLIVVVGLTNYYTNGNNQQKGERTYKQHRLYKYSPYKDHSVYVIKNKLNSKIYIGITSNYKRRKSEHFDRSYRLKENKLLYQQMEQLGAEHFYMHKILTSINKEEALYAEARLIQRWNTVYPNGYNAKDERENTIYGYVVQTYNKELFEKIEQLER